MMPIKMVPEETEKSIWLVSHLGSLPTSIIKIGFINQKLFGLEDGNKLLKVNLK